MEKDEVEKSESTTSENMSNESINGVNMNNVNINNVNTKKSWMRKLLSWVLVIGGGFLLARFVTRVIIVNAVAPTNSMETTIMVADRFIGNRLAYMFSSPERGDVIVFEYPDNPSKLYVKRVIGLPGEEITFKDGKVLVDGNVLEEDYVNGQQTEPQRQDTFTVPKDCYFMLGDNRVVSYDSRYWDNPFVSKDAIKGKVWFFYEYGATSKRAKNDRHSD